MGPVPQQTPWLVVQHSLYPTPDGTARKPFLSCRVLGGCLPSTVQCCAAVLCVCFLPLSCVCLIHTHCRQPGVELRQFLILFSYTDLALL